MAFDFAVNSLRAGFFDTKEIKATVDVATRKVLSKFGAFVRTRARSSIRKRKAISAPGAPPSGHTGALRSFIYFAFDSGSKSVVIGPARYRAGDAPGLLERGGVTRNTKRDGVKRLVYRPRPFMAPAAAAELNNLRDLLRGFIN